MTAAATPHSVGSQHQPEPSSSAPCIQSSLPSAEEHPFDIARQFRLKHPKNLIISHYNVNSIRHKFCELLPLTTECKVDILAIAETKLDDSFHSAQFNMCNYKLYRQDRNSHGGGIMIYVKDCIPHRLIKEHTGIHMGVEFMTIELSVKSNKWKLCYIYRPPSVNEKVFCDFLYQVCEAFICLFFGDMNCNLSSRNCLSDICDVFGLTNLVKQPTCFKSDIPTLLDIFLTNKPKSFVDVLNVDIGTSDFHNFVGVASRVFAPRQIRRKIIYRSMKNFHEDAFRADIERIPFHVSNVFDDIYRRYLLGSLANVPISFKWTCATKNEVG